VTPGYYDLRPVVARLPWPDVRGKRCLDVGTYDGFLAFELERRGAREVVALDIDRYDQLDWPAKMTVEGTDLMSFFAGEAGRGFEFAKEALGSRVERFPLSVYDLSPERVGEFDVVVCGSLLPHLRDPVAALEAIATVCSGRFLSSEAINLRLDCFLPRTPVARLGDPYELLQWWKPNRAGHRQMIETAGFEIERTTRRYSVAFGPGHPPRGRSPQALARSLTRRLLAGSDGVPHAAVLARRA
jgi:tRNA (mo5U34)-methyltransferase